MVAEQAVNRLPHLGLMLLAEGLGRAGVLKVRAPEEQDARGGQGQIEPRERGEITREPKRGEITKLLRRKS